MLNTKYLLALGTAGMLALGATSQSMAAPIVTGAAAVKAAAADDTINVQWRRWGWRGGWGRGLGIGLGLGLAAAALAGPYYGGYGYGGYGYGGPYGYAYGPAIAVVPAYGFVRPYYGWGYGRGRSPANTNGF